MKHLFIGLIRLYQWTLSPLVGGHCRFYPSCSHYAVDAYRQHGAWRGTRLTLSRLLRCRPFVQGGYDPVPPPASPKHVPHEPEPGRASRAS